MDEPQKTDSIREIPAAVAPKRPWPPNPFPKGNPGRPKGSLNHNTRVRQQLLACVGRDTLRLFKRQLRKPKDLKDFSKAMDQIIGLLGPAKPLVEIDNSRHTHMTVILESDGTARSGSQ